ncbi:MAG: hypothetical protein GY811_11835 [Myxococcales bacterium]|nr:hypothetical protein [Myxococcales bacterium]
MNIRASIIAAMAASLLAACGSKPSSNDETKSEAKRETSPMELADDTAAKLEALAVQTGNKELAEGAKTVRAAGKFVESVDRAEDLTQSMKWVTKAQVLMMEKRPSDDLDAEKVVAKMTQINTIMQRLEAEIVASPDSKEELEDAAMDEIYKLAGKETTPDP